MDKFDLIIKHLNRKKPKKDYDIDEPRKPVIEIKDNDLFCFYNFCYLFIRYNQYEKNSYHVSIEKQCVINQDIGTHYYSDDWYTQQDVIEYIRYKL